MEANKNACIVEIAQVEPRTGVPGHPNLAAYRFLKEMLRTGEASSIQVNLALDVIQPGGGIEEHFHADPQVFHHVYYVISGRIKASVGDIQKTVGRDSLIYCHSNVKHSIVNVGKNNARVLRISAQTQPDDFKTMTLSKK